MSRRTLLLVLVVVAGLAGAFFVLRGNGSSTSSTGSRTPDARTGGPVRRPTTPRVPPQELAVRRYAVHLRPVVDRASHAFDTAVRQAASSGGLSALAASCARSVTAIGVQEDYIEGVPHPYAWYTKAGLLHHQILGIYHRMEGSAVSCHTTAANNDRKAASTAISDMSAAARHLHRVAAQIRALTRLPH